MRFAPALAVLVTGLAMYLSRGVLDEILVESRSVRVALLPPWQALGGFLTMAALGLLWLDRRTVPRGTATAVRPPLGPLVLPMIGLVVLLLPYLPFLADRFPALQILAGPLRAVIWLAVLAQLLWVLAQSRVVRADWLQRLTIGRVAVMVGLLTALVSAIPAARFTGTVLFPGGDEPHYLVIAQSVWRDGDLKIQDNHTRRDYGEYYALDLEPHYLTRGANGEIYSIHPVGMPVIMAPVYAAGGYRAVVITFVLMAAAAASLMWLAVMRATSAAGAATFAWAAIALTTPFLYNTFAVYPEIPAALTVVLAFTYAVNPRGRAGTSRWAIVGLACAALPWLSTKYAPMSAALVLIALARIVKPAFARHDATRASTGEPTTAGDDLTGGSGHSTVLAPAAAVLVPYAVSLAGWFYFFYAIWGIPLPQAPYGALVQTDLQNLIFGAPGLLFDQEYGLLPYAPVYIFAVSGLWAMWRDGGDLRRRAVEVALIFGALLGTVGAFRIWWGGSASPGRPLTSGLLLLALPIAVSFRSAPAGSARRAAHHLVLWLSIGIAGIVLLAQEGLLISNGRDGTSSLLEYLSPRWPAWSMAPSFIFHEAPTALIHAGAWVALAALAAFALRRLRTQTPGLASLCAMAVCSVALVAGAIIVPRIPATPAWPGIEMRARPRLPLLDEFDATARPIGVEYTPLGIVPASDLVTRASLTVESGFRLEPEPIRVLHNGRFSLPAGRYRVEIEWGGDRNGETMGLQIGRTGDAWRTWNVEPRTGQRWTAEFAAPMDLSFVGLRGSAELERTVRRLSIAPLSVLDAARRPRLPTVIAASRSAGASIFYFDKYAFPEETGFWVHGGGHSTRVAIERATNDGPLTLQIHSGLITNRLRLSTFGWNQTVTLQPKLPDQVEIPSGARALHVLTLSADEAFIPAQLDQASRDVRQLGVWVEVVR